MNDNQADSHEASFPEEDVDAAAPPRRMFVFDRGWRVGVKSGSHRELCHMMAPEQDFYHRLGDGEVFVFQDTEKLCLPCAFRRGLIAFEPKRLREGAAPVVDDVDVMPIEIAFFEPTAADRQSSSSSQKGPTGTDTELFPS